MKHLFFIAALLVVISGSAKAQVLLYEQTFGGGAISSGPLSSVGWSNASPNTVENLIYAWNGIDQFYTWQGAAMTNAYYTATGFGTGPSGTVEFTNISPATYPYITLSIGNQGGTTPANLTVRFIVKVGGSWYASAKPIPTPVATSGGPYETDSLNYNPAATNWLALTITPTGATLGSPASSNLSGDIQGAGITIAWANAGSWNFTNFRITGSTTPPAPSLTQSPESQTVYAGAGVAFAVAATGTEPLSYFWQKDGLTLSDGGRVSGARTNRLTITSVAAGDQGQYSVIVSNAVGTTNSADLIATTLTVSSLPDDLLYAELFPVAGTMAEPLSAAGWSNAIPSDPNRVYQRAGGDGAFYAYQGSASTTAFYVTTNSDAGASGVSFRKINPALYPAVSFSADVAPNWQPANVTAYFAVQMNGGSWFVGSTPVPVDTSVATQTFTPCRQQFDPVAAQWNTLVLNPTSATIGAPASANLTGEITGAGLVFVHTGSGSFNIDNFLVTTNPVAPTAPTITFSPLSQTVYAGAGVSFAVNATGNRPFAYFWYKGASLLANGSRISGANSNILTLTGVTAADAGDYSVVVSNTAGTDSSANYFTTSLAVVDPPVGFLYAEAFPYVGPGTGGFPLSVVGWENAIPNAPNRLFQVAGGDGAAYAYQGGAATTAFFGAANLDPGISGLRFPGIELRFYPSLTFSVDIAPSFQATNVTAYFAVQMDGGPWYVSSTVLPVDTSFDSAVYSTYNQAFTPAAGSWRTLTLTPGNGAAIGSPTTWTLAGTITGAGLVFSHAGAGTFNFDNFQIIGTGLGGVTVNSVDASTISLSWIGNPGVRLQSTANLGPSATWVDVPNTAGASTATVARTGSRMFFRLIQQ